MTAEVAGPSSVGGRGCAGRDNEAAVVRFEAELRRFVRRRVPGPDGDDVAQDALLRVYLGAGRVRRGESLTAWVYRVARSAIVDHHRRLAARRQVALSDEVEDAAVLPEAPADDVRAGLAACVAPFLDGLSPALAEAVRIVDLEGVPQVEAAARLGLPLPTFKARVQRGRRALLASFDACCAFARDGRGAVVEATPRCGCA